MSKPRILLDTNILVSGLVFYGNEHQLLKKAETGSIGLVLSDFILLETMKVLGEKFKGYEGLLGVFLKHVLYELIPGELIQETLSDCEGKIRDKKDTHVLASVMISDPDYIVTGDRELREDLNEYLNSDKAVTSIKILEILD
jgi:putative PIN family toxin of toxin-antitoxin system